MLDKCLISSQLCVLLTLLSSVTAVCPEGKYGVDCTLTCPPNCQDGLCHPGDGTCIDCVPRFWGPSCNTSCSPLCSSECDQFRRDCLSCRVGYWDTQCAERCPGYCDTSGCDIRSGRCVGDCVDGYYGLYCNETCPTGCSSCKRGSGFCSVCHEGTRGQFCNLTCPPTCKGGGCTFVTGNCHDCVDGIWGLQCTNECGHRCVTCDQMTGNCTHCRDDHCGQNCEKRCSSTCQSDQCEMDTCGCGTPVQTGVADCQTEITILLTIITVLEPVLFLLCGIFVVKKLFNRHKCKYSFLNANTTRKEDANAESIGFEPDDAISQNDSCNAHISSGSEGSGFVSVSIIEPDGND